MNISQVTLGIDVSGQRLDAYAQPQGRKQGFSNDATGIARLIDWAAQLGAFVVLEATAPWDQPLIRALEASGLSFHRANPGRARNFARSAGLLAKTDAVDARMLALYGTAMPLPPTPPVPPERLVLQGLTARRDQLVEMRKAERTRLKADLDAVLVASIQEIVTLLDRQIHQIERHIEALIASSPSLQSRQAILRSAPGVGPVAASILMANLPELGQVDRRAIAALAGLAPIARDSGTLRGRRHVQGGRKRVRDALYMAALAAVRSKTWKHVFQTMKAAGKPPKLAIVAIARKLLVALNAALKNNRAFQTA